jgi:hypothetical protein
MSDKTRPTQAERDLWVQCYASALAGSAHQVAVESSSAEREATAAAQVADATIDLMRQRRTKGVPAFFV